jgi:hypothetical protein
MKEIWVLNADELLEIYDIAKKVGIKPGESIEPVLREYMKFKGRKPNGHTELNKEEFMKEIMSKNDSVLDININDQGKSEYRHYKKKEE